MPSSTSAPVDPTLCPLCGKPNMCAMEAAKSSGEKAKDCWCATASFSPELLALVPPNAQCKACICQTCTQSA